jgi:signal transduction histidine kinase
LSISYEVIRNHGGTIEAHSSAASTTFRITLPRVQPEITG